MAHSHSQKITRIKRLDNRLANQIAAGEVVERPASVVKELMENAIDAGASRIEVEIERGGTRLIRITDNGCGIVKDDLCLALSRHATSKISSASDLAAIQSLGFRGEALASISSVSRLCLTSRTKDSDYAWQAIAEGRDMQVGIQPASAVVGTRIEVKDLFYNTPARQKFLRAEKTEFGHIDEIFKRHALANFETAFILKHNHKVVKRVPAGRDRKDYLKRIESICGKAFAASAIAFVCVHDAIKIQGWLGGIDFHRSESDIQYVFINGRPVKDKMLNHAIRQSYQGLLPPGRMPTYVIFLQIEPDKIDVNVHPTKHEVRFDEQRMVHDLLVKSVSDALGDVPSFDIGLVGNENHQSEQSSQDSNVELPGNNNYPVSITVRSRTMGVGYSQVSYQSKNQSDNAGENIILNESISAHESVSTRQTSVYPQEGQRLYNKIRLDKGFWIILHQQNAYVINEQKLLLEHLAYLIHSEQMTNNQAINSKPLLFPQAIELDTSDLEEFETLKTLQNLGFIFQPGTGNTILLQQVPSWLDSVDNQRIFSNFPKWIKSCAQVDDKPGAKMKRSKLNKCKVSGQIHSGLDEIYRSLNPLPDDTSSVHYENRYSLLRTYSS